MNTLFQWVIKNMDAIAISISLVSLFLSIIGFVRSSTSIQKQKKRQKLKKIWSVRHSIFHTIALFCLTLYVLFSWEKCISMKFWDQFNGNNILFLVWIADIMLFFYDIEIKESKLHRRNIEEAKKQVQDRSVELEIGQREEKINRAISEISSEINGGDK